MKRLILGCALPALFAVALVGCKTSTEPATGNNNVTVVHPAAGSSYTYHTTTKDSSGAITEEYDHTKSVVAVNVSIAGRTDAIEVVDDTEGDTTYYAIQSNGDILLYGGSSGQIEMPSAWVTLPFSGGAGTSLTLIDTTGEFVTPGVPMREVLKIMTTSAGSESVVAAGKTFTTRKVKQSLVFETTVAGVTTSVSQDAFVWLAPEIGYYVKRDQPSQNDLFTGDKDDAELDLLTSYTLK